MQLATPGQGFRRVKTSYVLNPRGRFRKSASGYDVILTQIIAAADGFRLTEGIVRILT